MRLHVSRKRVAGVVLALCLSCIPAHAQAQQSGSAAPPAGAERSGNPQAPLALATSVEVFGTGEPSKIEVSPDPRSLPASVSVLHSAEVRRRTYREPGELLRALPGVGFAYYGQGAIPSGPSVRGYTDRNFGQDIAGHLDGIPLNTFGFVASHGALDLTPIFPESLERIELVRGPLDARYGDFNRGASVNFVTKSAITRPSVSVTTGSFGTLRATGIFGRGGGGDGRVSFYSSVDGQTSNGYSDNQDVSHIKTFHKLRLPFGRNTLSVAALTFSSEWNAPGYLDIDAVRRGAVDEKQAVNPTDGGDQQLQLLYAQFERGGRAPLSITGYVGHSDWRRFRSDFLISPTQTQVRQIDRRVRAGYRVEQSLNGTLLGRRALFVAGTTLHRDDAETRQANTLRRDVIRLTDDVPEVLTNVAAYAQQQWQVASRLKLTGGLRYSHISYDIDDRLRDPRTFVDSYSDFQVSPKGGIAFAPVRSLELYANVATGMRSPTPRTEVRNSVESIERVDIAETTSYEGGGRLLLFDRLDLRASVWRADNTNEIRGIPPGGTQFESLGESRRTGQEAEIRLYATAVTRIYSTFSWVKPRLLTPSPPAAVHLPDVPEYVHQIGIESAIPTRRLPVDALVVSADLSFYGAKKLNTVGTLTSEPYQRLTFRALYEPTQRYRLWLGGFAYPTSRLGESAFLFRSTVGVRPNPRVAIDAGITVTF